MTLNETIVAMRHLPLDESLPAVIEALRGAAIIVAMESEPEPGATSFSGAAATDKNGITWSYVYSSVEAARAANLGDWVLASIPFVQWLGALRNSGFGGVAIDVHDEDGFYLIFIEHFEGI